jgi:two-component system sensor histidine kinase PhcS
MNDRALQQSYEEKNRRDYVSAAALGSLVSIPLQLSCAIMDWFMYGRENPALWWLFLKVRILVATLTAVVWFWFRSAWPCHRRIFGMTWYVGPLFMVLWMIYAAKDPISPYYAGLNIILLAMCLISPWTFWQNLSVTVFTVVMYVLVVCLSTAEPVNYVMNNTTFLFLTAAFVIIGSWTNSRQRYHEFYLRYELDKNKRELETTNEKLSTQNGALARANQEIRAAEMQLVQAEKLASLGRFSAGLMHDVLNPLNYAKTGTFTLRKKLRALPPEDRKEFENILTDVDDGLKRVDNIVSDLRSFTHPGGQEAESTDLSETLNMALRFVGSELKEKNVRVETAVPAGLKAWISHNHLTLVFVNLVENAIDALVEKNFPAGESPAIHIAAGTKDGRTYLRVRDNGPGIAREHLSKVFDPFYTTKDVGKGTGLGLSICFGILRGYSGDITAASEPGKFCEFTLTLPDSGGHATKDKNAEPTRA